jgi:hypothetical protein
MDYISDLPDEVVLIIVHQAPKLTRTCRHFRRLAHNVSWERWLDERWFTPTTSGVLLINVFYRIRGFGLDAFVNEIDAKFTHADKYYSIGKLNEMIEKDGAGIHLTHMSTVAVRGVLIYVSILVDGKVANIYVMDNKIQFIEYAGTNIRVVRVNGEYKIITRHKNIINISDGILLLNNQISAICVSNSLMVLVKYIDAIIYGSFQDDPKKAISDNILEIKL